ncbi:MAG: tryptophan 2,3-dioxygenase [Thermoleophilia bacterium]|nr:tryptophan 2,3-dioxygenase [Thermoleophilia bacterium]
MAEDHARLEDPVLPGVAPSDYERYLRTDELLSLQKGPADWVHRDELLFQVTHQSSELWLKLASSEIAEATRLLEDEHDVAEAVRQLRRPLLAIRLVADALEMLEQMSPWEYQDVRKVLGHGSGFDSPGFREFRRILPPLGDAFQRTLDAAGLDVAELCIRRRDHDALYRLAESLIELDEWAQQWRLRHYKVVTRIIGDAVVGTQGTPVEVLGRLVGTVVFPELWQARNTLTARAKSAG